MAMRQRWIREVAYRVVYQCHNYENGCGPEKYFYRATIAPIVAHKYKSTVTIYQILGMSMYGTYPQEVHVHGKDIQRPVLSGISIFRDVKIHFKILIYSISGEHEAT